MDWYVLTLFPELIDTIVNTSITGRAVKKGILRLHSVNIRDYAERADGRVDDYPYGGGAGMVMQAEPVVRAVEAAKEASGGQTKVIYLTPQAKVLTQPKAEELAREKSLILLCGHYEGIDERALDACVDEYLSIGDYVMTGGELGAAVVIDVVSRFVPGVLPNDDSARFESLQDNLLEYPQYTRPVEWRGEKVPAVLLSGDHTAVEKWRYEESLKRTKERRPDLMKKNLHVTCITGGGDTAAEFGKKYTDAVTRYGDFMDFDRRKLQKSGRKFGPDDLVIFALTQDAMDEARFRSVSGDQSRAVILLVSGTTNPGQEEKEREADTCRPSSEAEEVDLFMNEGEDWDMAPVRMEMMLNRKGFRVVTLASADAGTSDEEIAGMAVALREKLDAESG